MTKAMMFGMVGGVTIAMGAIVLPADSFSIQDKNESEAAQTAVVQEYEEPKAEPAVVQQDTAAVGQGYGCEYVDGHHTGTCPYVDENHTELCSFVDENHDGICDLGNHHSSVYSGSSTSNSTVSAPAQGTGYGRHHSQGRHHGGRHH